MTLGESINKIKNRANDLDLNVLHTNPGTYYNEIVELLQLINSLEEPTEINIKDLQDRTYQV